MQPGTGTPAPAYNASGQSPQQSIRLQMAGRTKHNHKTYKKSARSLVAAHHQSPTHKIKRNETKRNEGCIRLFRFKSHSTRRAQTKTALHFVEHQKHRDNCCSLSLYHSFSLSVPLRVFSLCEAFLLLVLLLLLLLLFLLLLCWLDEPARPAELLFAGRSDTRLLIFVVALP